MDIFEVDKKRIPKIVEKDFEDAAIITAYAGTTGPKGGDWGHGCTTYIGLQDAGGTGWIVRLTGSNGRQITIDTPERIEILFGGDAELFNIIKALGWMAHTLEAQIGKEKQVGEVEQPESFTTSRFGQNIDRLKGERVTVWLTNGRSVTGTVEGMDDDVLYLRKECDRWTNVLPRVSLPVYLIRLDQIVLVEVNGITAAERSIVHVPQDALLSAKRKMKAMKEAIGFA